VNEAAVYLVPIGSGRYELYSEPPDDLAHGASPESRGFWSRQLRAMHGRWRQAADAAGTGAAGPVGRARDWLVRRVAESIAEQRTLWSLRTATTATFAHPADLSSAAAAGVRTQLLARARDHHRRWAWADAAATSVTAVLMVLPGPNLIGYYFVFRMFGHFLSWRGARQALDRTEWRARAEPALAELGRLAHRPRDERAEEVGRVCAALGLPRLAVFFERAAVPGR
jgi:hypothetical protein